MTRTALWKQAVLAAFMMALAAAAWAFRGDITALWSEPGPPETATAAADAPGVPVFTAEVADRSDDLTFSAIGTGFARRSVTLRAPSSGRITQLSIDPGRTFAAGDTLMRLDDTDEKLAVALAEARLARASSERDRYRRLQDSGAAAVSRFEEVETAHRVAEIELEKARAELADRHLLAPFDGVPGIAQVEVGDRVSAEDEIASYDDRRELLVEFDLPETLLSRVEVGLDVTATTPAVEGRRFEGRVTAIDSRVNRTTRTARVRAAVANEADVLRPGASFSVTLELPGPVHPSVPELALQFSRGALHVWRVVDGTVEKVELRLVRRRAGLVIVDGPLAAGDHVVVEGTQRLRPGVAVNVLNAPAGGSS
ncbi:efflux RND transporter periplasmic adaptor subunit [Roseovarius sp. SYSU LYC5161]|uniref:efflux RND transporter periplasmic adaptor subunit n=1 Tax=Roseovarius halophilus (ex Wu et al. 2025) TaxID=3376060 RepID=UPI00399AF52B